MNIKSFRKKKDDFIISQRIINESDIEYEKNNILVLNNEKTNFSLTFQNIYYPKFKFNRMSLTQYELEHLPYAECFTCAFDENGDYIACGYNNGYVSIFSLREKKSPIIFKVGDYPVTSIKWNKKKQTTLLVGSSDGYVSHWHTTSGKILHSLHEIDNSINTVDYSKDYRKFITGGNDVTVRLYDEGMKSLITSMKPYKFEQPGHSGRIFTVKFHPENNTTILSGGWDKTIQFYDSRIGKIVNSIYGPNICGDGLDIDGSTILTGAWSREMQIQLWDMRMLKCIKNVKWENDGTYFPTYLYCAKFNSRRDFKTFAVGGVNKPCYRLFNYDTFSPFEAQNQIHLDQTLNSYNNFITNNNTQVVNVMNINNNDNFNEEEISLNTTLSTVGLKSHINDGNNIETNLNNNILSHTVNISNQRNNLIDNLFDVNKNMPVSIYAPKEIFNAVYTIDFVRIGNKKEYFAYGSGDGGLRLFVCEKK